MYSNNIGLQVTIADEETTLSQDSYIASLKEIPIFPSCKLRKNDRLTLDEEKRLRMTVGQLNWVHTQTRPDILFDVLELNMIIKSARVEHLLQANKVIRKLKSEPSKIVFPRLGQLESLHLLLYNDASYANLPVWDMDMLWKIVRSVKIFYRKP